MFRIFEFGLHKNFLIISGRWHFEIKDIREWNRMMMIEWCIVFGTKSLLSNWNKKKKIFSPTSIDLILWHNIIRFEISFFKLICLRIDFFASYDTKISKLIQNHLDHLGVWIRLSNEFITRNSRPNFLQSYLTLEFLEERQKN